MSRPRARHITTGEAAHALDVVPSTLLRWMHEGAVTPAGRTRGGHYRWDLDQLRRDVATLDEQEVRPVQAHDAPVKPPVATAIITSTVGVLIGARVDGKPPWTFIAGKIEQGESPQDAAIREVKEETGLVVTVDHTIGERIHPRTGVLMHYVAASSPAGSTEVFNGDPEELSEVRWATLSELDERMGRENIYAPVRDYLADHIPH